MLTVKVTKEHIKKGEPKNCYSCPIALALKENKLHSVRIGLEDWSAVENGAFISGPLSRGAKKFIKYFDTGSNEVKPSTFRLQIWEEYLK